MVLRRICAHMRDLSGALLRSVLTNNNNKHDNTMKHLFVRELRIPTYLPSLWAVDVCSLRKSC